MLFVVLSYFIANKFGFLYNSFFIFKAVFLIFCFVHLSKRKFINFRRNALFFFLLIFSSSLFFSNYFVDSLLRGFTYIIGFFYIYSFVNYLKTKYNYADQVLIITVGMLVIYTFPILMLFLNFDIIISEGYNIYGKESILNSIGFLSNNLGWSSAMAISCVFTLIDNYELDFKKVFILIIIILMSLFVLSVSGSRSGILCLFLITFVYFLKSNKSKLKIFVLAFSFLLYLSLPNFDFFNIENTRLISDENSSLELDKEDEYRVIALQWVFNYFNENKLLWFTGYGFDQISRLISSKVIFTIGDFKVQGDLHNSYLQFLFETGIFSFFSLIFLYILPSLINFIKNSKVVYFYLPAMIIPYFENNLNLGQFLFFPFIFSFIYLASTKLNSNV
jgi:O-antigen ligase